MKLFIFRMFIYIMILKHQCFTCIHILSTSSNNLTLLDTSPKLLRNRTLHINSFIILSFCITSLIILCLYAILYNRQSTTNHKINGKSFYLDKQQSSETRSQKQDKLAINDSLSNDSNTITYETNLTSSKTYNSIKSNSSF